MNQKVCVITGIGPGLGIAYARRFSEGGYRVALLGRTREKLERYAEEISGSLAVVCDVSDSRSVASAFQTVRAELGDPLESAPRPRRFHPRHDRHRQLHRAGR